MKKSLSFLSCFFALFISVAINAQIAKQGYQILNKIHLPGEGGWDYLSVDETGNRLFVSHGTVVQVVDLKSGQLTGTITETPGVHGIALAPDLNKAFISVGRNNSVKIINFNTLELIAEVKITGENPDAIMYDAFSQKVFVFNGRTSNASVIDAKTNAVVATIPLDGKPEFPVSDGKGLVFVNIEDKSQISVINIKTLKVDKSWSIAPGEEPSGLALDNETHRLFSVCSNKLMVVVNALDGKVVATLPIGDGCDGVKFDPALKRVYSSNGEGTMTVVLESDNDKYSVLENVPTMASARTMAVDSRSHHLYLPAAEYNPAPEATSDNPRPRRTVKPDSFVVMEIAPVDQTRK